MNNNKIERFCGEPQRTSDRRVCGWLGRIPRCKSCSKKVTKTYVVDGWLMSDLRSSLWQAAQEYLRNVLIGPIHLDCTWADVAGETTVRETVENKQLLLFHSIGNSG